MVGTVADVIAVLGISGTQPTDDSRSGKAALIQTVGWGDGNTTFGAKVILGFADKHGIVHAILGSFHGNHGMVGEHIVASSEYLNVEYKNERATWTKVPVVEFGPATADAESSVSLVLSGIPADIEPISSMLPDSPLVTSPKLSRTLFSLSVAFARFT